MAADAATAAAGAAVLHALPTVPRDGVPAMLQALIQATGAAPSQLLHLLLKSLPLKQANGQVEVEGSLEAASKYMSVHFQILIHPGSAPCDLATVLYSLWLPLLQSTNVDVAGLQLEVVDMLSEAVSKRSAWDEVLLCLVPVCSNSITFAMSHNSPLLDHNLSEALEQSQAFGSGASCPAQKPVSVRIACRLLTTLLLHAMELFKEADSSNEPCCYKEAKTSPALLFCKAVLNGFFPLSVALLSQTSDRSLRQLAMHKLLPAFLRASDQLYVADCSLEHDCLRGPFVEQVWVACKSLLSHGGFERYDAFVAFAQFIEFFLGSGPRSSIGAVFKPRKFDARNDPEFWNFIKLGLVDLDSVTRKRALFALKRSLPTVSKVIAGNGNQNRDPLVNAQQVLSRREKWAQQEATALGLVVPEDRGSGHANSGHRWNAFVLLYEALEEYGTHLVEATWNLQISLLLPALEIPGVKVGQSDNSETHAVGAQIEMSWISVLWQRGFGHKNPQVRRLVVRSFLDSSLRYRSALICLKEDFVLGPFLSMLNDTIQHRDFGVQGVYDSETTRRASKFIWAYTENFGERKRTDFVLDMANAIVLLAPCRAGFMAMTSCLEVASVGKVCDSQNDSSSPQRAATVSRRPIGVSGKEFHSLVLLEKLKLVVEDSKRHYNPEYRAQACCHILRAALALVTPSTVPFAKVAYFLLSFPRDILASEGVMHEYLMSWLQASEDQSGVAFDSVDWAFGGLLEMAENFLCLGQPMSGVAYGDEDVESWGFEGDRWARMVTAGLLPVHKQLKLVEYVKQQACQVYHRAYMLPLKSEKTLVLLHSLVKECQHGYSVNHESPFAAAVAAALEESLDELVAYAKRAVVFFWEPTEGLLSALPGSVTGKLGGPSQRRLSETMTCHVLQAMLSVTTISHGCSWYSAFNKTAREPVLSFLWHFAWNVVHSTSVKNEPDAELILGAFEILPAVCRALAATATPLGVSWGYYGIQAENRYHLPEIPGMIVDELVKGLLTGVENLRTSGFLARSRRAVLARLQWCCLDCLIAMPRNAVFPAGNHSGDGASYPCAVPNSTLWIVLKEALGCLESAAEDYLLPLFRTLRALLNWGILEDAETVNGQKRLQVLWALVNSAWAAIVDCNKRKVSVISAFLSTIFHPALFRDVAMHYSEGSTEIGPLKWLLGRLIEEGRQSPRIMRLVTLHVTGLWLQFPATVIHYVPEIQCLSLHGGENVDEELDGEVASSKLAAREYLTLIRSSDPELAEAFSNSEMYVRVSVAIMVDQFAQMVEKPKEQQADVCSAATFGRTFLLSLLQATVEDPSLSKELYKKRSAIHRKKVRAWQMLCILSRFVNDDIVLHVLSVVHTCLYKNNMPSVRQYMENFVIQILLRYPDLVPGHLLSYLEDYNFKTQALASYVFIAANLLIFIPCKRLQLRLLEDVLPVILPYMTSHHHNLRSFTQVLIHRLLQHIRVSDLGAESSADDPSILGNQLLLAVAGYLDANADCARIRTSVGRLLDNYDPAMARTSRGIFVIREGELNPEKGIEELPFECVPPAALDLVAEYLSEARNGLRVAMAADAVGLIGENGGHEHGYHCGGASERVNLGDLPQQLDSDNAGRPGAFYTPLDFQKKITSMRLPEAMGDPTGRYSWHEAAVDLEEELLLSSLVSSAREMRNLQGDRQELVVVASFLGSIPNLAGLARTCEVFKVGSLVVADAGITLDKQFQLISVTAEQWVPLVEVPEVGVMDFLLQKKKQGFSLLGLEQTANSVSIDSYSFPRKSVLVLGKEKQGIPVELIQALDCCLEIPQLGVIRSLNVHVSGAIAVWEYTRQHSKGGVI